jgi:hypothetical protein
MFKNVRDKRHVVNSTQQINLYLFLIMLLGLGSVPSKVEAEICPDITMTCPTGGSFERGLTYYQTRCEAARPIEKTLASKCGTPKDVPLSNLDWWYEQARQKHACSSPVGPFMSNFFGTDSPWLHEACVIHDMCYRSERGKEDCDDDLVRNIKVLCKNYGLSDFLITGFCNTVAATIPLAMRSEEAYNANKGNKKQYKANTFEGLKKGNASNDVVQYELQIDCHGYGGIKNTGTENAIFIKFMTRGQGNARSHYIPDAKCNSEFGHIAIHNGTEGSKIESIQISTTGDDGFWIDRIKLNTRSQSTNVFEQNWGANKGQGYCLSTDPTDADRTWKNYVSNRGCQQCLDFRIDKDDVVICGR